MKKMLMIASVASMIDQFNMENIKILKELGYEVHVAANFESGNTSSQQRIIEFKNELKDLSVTYFQIDFSRNILDIVNNYKAYKQIIRLIKQNKYHFVHCHSPIGGVCGRLAAYKTSVKVIYTAHGFHFYKNAPIKNWMLFYPIENFCAKFTDVLITINKEDYALAKNFGSTKVAYVPGIGIDTIKYRNDNTDKNNKRNQFGIPSKAIVILSVGELSKRKNHEIVIEALAKLNNPNIIYIICGQGNKEKYLENKAKLLNVNVKFLGYMNNIHEIFAASDLFAFPSLQEGLPVALMEAMSAGLPIVCSKIRGNCDLVEDNLGGYLVEPNNIDGFSEAINKIINNPEVRNNMKEYNQNVIKNYDSKIINKMMRDIYLQID